MMTRIRGRAQRGHRVIASVPHGHWMTSTFVAGLRNDSITAPLVLNCPMNGRIFLDWIDQFLVPTLCPGDTVIMDNLPAHKVAGVRQRIEAAHATLAYLPPYSCDFNPIEQVFAKLKALLRKAAERSLEALWTKTGECLDCFPPNECANYLRHCGYVSTATASS